MSDNRQYISSSSKMTICPLASGSKGNSTFIASGSTKLLVDAGISLKSIQERLSSIGVDIREIDAVILTHEHSDHIAGLKAITSKYQIPVIANAQTAEAVVEVLQECPKFKIMTTLEPFEVGDIEVLPFPVRHDAIEPVAMVLSTNKHKVGICTDLGFVTTSIRHHLRDADVLIVEANHKPEFVHASSRPDVYKTRVLSRIGHLSNEECGKLLVDVAHAKLKKVYLAHLSSECNTAEVALATVQNILEHNFINLSLCIALQECASELVHLE
jgi:phosphoribosyl 1,2-cyclic phosphodiesterase